MASQTTTTTTAPDLVVARDPVVPRFKWEDAPIELVDCIARFLRPEEKAVLALTNWTLRTKLDATSGTNGDVFKMPTPEAKYNLLLLLSRDGSYLPRKILCQWCRLFHDPTPTDDWTAERGPTLRMSPRRACERFTTHKNQTEGSVALPWRLHYNQVMAVMRCHRFGLALNPGGWQPGDLSQLHVEPTVVTEQGHKLATRHRYHIADNRLLLVTERLLWLGKRQSDIAILESLSEVSQMLKGVSPAGSKPSDFWRRNALCPHLTWPEVYPHVFQNADKDIGPDCLLESWTSTENLKKVEQVQFCKYCYTDFALGFLSMPRLVEEGQGPPSPTPAVNVCVLMTWKCLGTGLTVKDNQWRTHLCDHRGVEIVTSPIVRSQVTPSDPSPFRLDRTLRFSDNQHATAKGTPVTRFEKKRVLELWD